MRSQRFSISKLQVRNIKQAIQKSVPEGEKPPTLEEQIASVSLDEEPTSDGEDCELHVYENRTDTRGEKVTLRVGTKSEIPLPKRRSHRACLVLTRYYYSSAELTYTELEIQSRHIVKALRDVIGTYDGIDFNSKFVSIMEPPRCLFHYQDELTKYAEASDNQQLKLHVRLCLQYMEKTLQREIKIFQSIMSNETLSPELEHRHLWMVFKPGCLVYENISGIENLSRLRSIHSEEDCDSDEIVSWILYTERIDYIKSDVGLTHHRIEIKRYDGCKPVCDLTAVPVRFHPEAEKIKHDLLERGLKFLSLGGVHHCFYDGVAHIHSKYGPRDSDRHPTNVRHRIIIDIEQYTRNVETRSSLEFVFGTSVYSTITENKPKFSDEDTMTCNSYIPGYSLELKVWGVFAIDNIKEVAYNDIAFDGLVLAEKKKKLISSLVKRQVCQQDDFDDLIQGKGRGLVFLLHGPPGVGKTYTAESIADHTRRPLLKINSSELGLPGFWVEERLSHLFSLATRWSAIMLLDEADVFMQERRFGNLESNWMVATLLRVLEYYEGILFLTTNRSETIDLAFKSRIHLSISYPPLSADARRQLWQTSIVRANLGQQPEWLTTEFLDYFTENNANGREIRNIVRIASGLARHEKRGMEADDLLEGLNALKQFDADFSQWLEQRKGTEVEKALGGIREL